MTARLEAEFWAARGACRFIHVKALEAKGVSRSTLAHFNRDYGFGIIKASEHPSEPGLFIHDPGGPPHLALPVVEDGELIDLVAFRSNTPNAWLLRTGDGWCLGLETGLERHTWGDPVPVAVSPLEWLQGGAQGLCILDWDAAELHYLAGVPELVCSNEHQAAMLRSALTRPVYLPSISVQEAQRAAA